MKSTTEILRGAAATAAVLCLMFAGSAKADCGLVSATRATMNPDLTAPALQAKALSARALPEQTSDATANVTLNIGLTDPITGLWMATFTSGGQVVDQGIDAWTSDGLEILNDTPPPSTGNVCLGTWQKIGLTGYKLYHPSWTFDNNGNLNGMGIIRETIALSADRQSFKGSYTIDFLTLNGANVGHYTGTISATRITVE
jgi:hypothetical protein